MTDRRRHWTAGPWPWLLLIIAVAVSRGGCRREDGTEPREGRSARRIDAALAPASAATPGEGLAAAILIDVSGSMNDEVDGEGGRDERKIDIARRAAANLVEQFARYAEEHKDEPVLLGIYEFSERRDQQDCRPVLAMARPDRERARTALQAMRPDGGTPIGSAMITGKRELDATGLTRRHLLVVTDGENTDGYDPNEVAAAIGRRPEAERPSIYFVAFDIAASRFNGVKDAGALLLSAANARELNDTLDTLLRGKILIEK
jgi:Mg-chelatase subunit ChlD